MRTTIYVIIITHMGNIVKHFLNMKYHFREVTKKEELN